MPRPIRRTPAYVLAARDPIVGTRRTQHGTLGLIYLACALAPTFLALQHMPPPGLSVLLYAALAVWAELLVVPPAYAGWPSPLFPLLTLILLDAGPSYVLPIALLALGVRSVRRRLVQPDRWPWPVLCYEAGIWLLATAAGVAVAQGVDATWRSSPWQGVLADTTYGVLGLLLTALAWSLTVALVCLLAGLFGARMAEYRRKDLALPARLRRSMIRVAVRAILVYTVVGVCMAFLGPQGTYIVVVAVGCTLVALWWQARGRQRRQAMLTGLAELAEAKDATTGTHLLAVADRTTLVAAALGLPAARIVAVVDAFDAMTADRPYHRGISAEEARVELHRQRGSQFDPAVVDAFERTVTEPTRSPLWRFFPLSDYSRLPTHLPPGSQVCGGSADAGLVARTGEPARCLLRCYDVLRWPGSILSHSRRTPSPA
jgi:hypothetical protein